MKNLHKPVMLNEIKSFIPNNLKLNVIDATFGGGGYSKAILKNFEVNEILAIDRDPISQTFTNDIKSNHQNFTLVNDKFSRLGEIVKKSKLKQKKI